METNKNSLPNTLLLMIAWLGGFVCMQEILDNYRLVIPFMTLCFLCL